MFVAMMPQAGASRLFTISSFTLLIWTVVSEEMEGGWKGFTYGGWVLRDVWEDDSCLSPYCDEVRDDSRVLFICKGREIKGTNIHNRAGREM